MNTRIEPEKNPAAGLQKHLCLVVLIFGGALALGLRLFLVPYQSSDFTNYLQDWYGQMAAGGGMASLRQPLNDCNYTLAYLTLLAPFAEAGFPALPVVKGISIAFDFLLAGAVARLLRRLADASRAVCAAGALLTLFLPTVFLNSGMWGQCDAIYAAFCLLSLGALIERRGLLACVLLGLGFAFKLQAAFFLPLFLLAALTDRRVRLWHFAAVPAVVWLSGLPAMAVGAPPWLVFYMYGVQLDSAGGALSAGCPNLPLLFSNETVGLLYPAFLLLGLAVVLLGGAVALHAGHRLTGREAVLFAGWCLMACICFLPAMHERYLFPADLILWVRALDTRCRGDFVCAFAESGVSLCSYLPVLQGTSPVPMPVLAVVRLCCFAFLTAALLRAFYPRLLNGKAT